MGKDKANRGGACASSSRAAAGGFGGNPTRFANYGLGKAAKATNVKVVWPDGKITKIGDVLAGETKKVTWP